MGARLAGGLSVRGAKGSYAGLTAKEPEAGIHRQTTRNKQNKKIYEVLNCGSPSRR